MFGNFFKALFIGVALLFVIVYLPGCRGQTPAGESCPINYRHARTVTVYSGDVMIRRFEGACVVPVTSAPCVLLYTDSHGYVEVCGTIVATEYESGK